MIRHALALQFHLENAGLVVAPVEHGKIPEVAALVEAHGQDFIDYPLGLGLFVGAADQPDWVAVSQFAPQGLFKQVRVIGDQLVGRVQNPGRGAIILLQFNHLQAGKVLLQLRHVFRTGAAPGVD